MGDDWVQVRLSEFGERYTAGAAVHVHEGQHEFSFHPGEPQRVTRAFDWERILKNVTIAGNPLFEIAPAPAKEPPLKQMLEKPQRATVYLKDKGEQA